MTTTTVGPQCPDFMRDFQSGYLPHQEWLLLCAYAYSTNCPDHDAAVDLSPFNKKEKQIIKQLVGAIGIYNNKIDHFLTWDYEITKPQADHANTRIMLTFGDLVEYYTKLTIRIEEFYDGGFFDHFHYMYPDASKEFAKLVWNDKSMKLIEFAGHAILDFLLKYNYTDHKWKYSIPDMQLDKNGARALVIGDLLKFYHKTAHAFWENTDADPRKKISSNVLSCAHNDWVLGSDGVPLCEICDAELIWGGYHFA